MDHAFLFFISITHAQLFLESILDKLVPLRDLKKELPLFVI